MRTACGRVAEHVALESCAATFGSASKLRSALRIGVDGGPSVRGWSEAGAFEYGQNNYLAVPASVRLLRGFRPSTDHRRVTRHSVRARMPTTTTTMRSATQAATEDVPSGLGVRRRMTRCAALSVRRAVIWAERHQRRVPFARALAVRQLNLLPDSKPKPKPKPNPDPDPNPGTPTPPSA